MSNAKRDDNRVPSLLAVSDVDGTTVVPLQADSVTKRLKVAAVISGGGGGTPGGSDTQVQFNDAGAFGGDAGLTYNKTTDVLTAGNIIDSGLTASSAVATDGSKQLVSVTNTGTGNNVLATSPTLVTPILGTPTSGTLTNCTGLPLGSVTGLGTNVSTFLATPSSANLRAALTDETGTGAAVFADTPTLVTPVLGVATATSINKVALTAPATSATLTLADGSTLATSGANSITLTSTGATNVTLPTTGTLSTLAGSETLTNKTLTAPKFADLGFIADANGNELIIMDTVASAVNEITVANAATAGNPKISATGGDTDIGLDLQSKGADPIRLNNAGGDIEVGGAATASSLKFMEPSGSGTNYTAFKAAAQTGNVTYTLPPADGSADQVLKTDGSGSLSWATASGSGFDPSSGVQLFEDFVSGGNGALANTNPLFGSLGWAWTGSGNIDLGQTYEASHPGWVTLGTTTGTTNYSTIAIGAQNGSGGTLNSSGSWIIASGDSFTMHWWVRFPTLSVLAQRYVAYIGFGDGSNIEPPDGIYFKYDEATSANWIISTAAGGSRSPTTTSTAVAANTWTKLSIVYTGGTATYYVNGASVGTESANIPTNATSIRAGITKSAGSTARFLDVDAMYLNYTFNTSR